MRIAIFLLIYSIICFNCQKNTKPKDFSGDKQFQTTDPSRLYFNNIRSLNYYRSRRPNSKIDIYKARKNAQTDKRPILYPMILDNWLESEAYIFLEKNAYVDFADPLTIRIVGDSIETISIDIFNKKNQYVFATNIYKGLLARRDLSVETKQGNFVPIFANYQDKNNFVMTMRDYFELIEKDRKERQKN